MSAVAAVRALSADRSGRRGDNDAVVGFDASLSSSTRMPAADLALQSVRLGPLRLSLHDTERAEIEARVEIEASESRERARIPPCDLPDALVYRAKLAEAKAQLLDGPVYRGLITRQFKREERLLEYFTERLRRLSIDEDAARTALSVDERNAAYTLERFGALVAYYAIAGYAGTTIAVETDEREAREAGPLAQEADERLALEEEFAIGAELATRASASRSERDADEQAVVADEESIGRWRVAEAEEFARIEYERDFLETWRRLCRRLEWVVVTTEADARYAIERDEQRTRARELWRAWEQWSLVSRDADADATEATDTGPL